jgi:hexosaminidase
MERFNKSIAALALLAVATAGGTPPDAAQSPDQLSLVPLPSSLERATGAFAITSDTTIAVDTAVEDQGRYLAAVLAPAMGFDLRVVTGPAPTAPSIELRQDRPQADPGADEAYGLAVGPDGVRISASTPAGIFYGIQTLRQLLPPDVFSDTPVTNASWVAPAVTIEDDPRFSWRGSHLDVSRYFMPLDYIRKHLDLMALHKLNRFHWHLTDDQGWRVEIQQYPRLTEVGAWRAETIIGHERNTPDVEFDGTRHGGFYTQDEIEAIVAYAAERFITVIPEIEMPGHSQAVVAAYPELGSVEEPVEPKTRWGVSPYILNPEDHTIRFMQNVLAEVLELFPSPWIHIGGDEARKTQWENNPRIQARIQALGLADEDEMQSWFIQQMDTFLTERGRRLIGWDEILEGGLAENATVMAWRGIDAAVEAARSGHDAVLAPTSHTYFDYYQSEDRENEPLAIGGFLPLEKVYTWEPMPSELEPAFRHHILGVQGQLWTEYLKTPSDVEYMAFPRLTALAEVAWTPTDRREMADFRLRLATHLERLRLLDVNFRPPDLQAGDEVVQLYLRDLLASVARPVTELKGFHRVHLDPGESRELVFRLGSEDLRMLDADMQWVVEPGTFRVMVGASSEDVRLRGEFRVGG